MYKALSRIGYLTSERAHSTARTHAQAAPAHPPARTKGLPKEPHKHMYVFAFAGSAGIACAAAVLCRLTWLLSEAIK